VRATRSSNARNIEKPCTRGRAPEGKVAREFSVRSALDGGMRDEGESTSRTRKREATASTLLFRVAEGGSRIAKSRRRSKVLFSEQYGVLGGGRGNVDEAQAGWKALRTE